MKLFFCALFLVVLAGCSNTPTTVEIESADYGSFPSKYKELVQQSLNPLFKDPSSTIYNNWRNPKRAYDGQFSGYNVCVNVNSKNSFGGYSGAKLYYVFIRNGQVIQILRGAESDCQSITRARG